MRTFFITGGAGFIGSALIRCLINVTKYKVIKFDKLTYVGNLESLKSVDSSERCFFAQGDICDRNLLKELLGLYQPNYAMHLAAKVTLIALLMARKSILKLIFR